MREVLSGDLSPCLLTPIVASSTRKISYPPSLMRDTTSEICSESERDSLMASPSSFMSCLSCGSTSPPSQSPYNYRCHLTPNGSPVVVRWRCAIVDPDAGKIEAVNKI